MAPFDPYHNWLGIPPHEHPANYYRLLGLVMFESNSDVIAQAANRQAIHVGSFQNGPYGNYCEQIMGEIAQAAACLLDPQQKAPYDSYLQESLSARGERSVMAAPPPPSALGQPAFGQATFGQPVPMDPYGQTSMHQSPAQLPPPHSFGQPVGEMPMPQFNLPPTMASGNFGSTPPVSHGMGQGGLNAPVINHAAGQPMPSFLPGPPSPIQARPMQANPMQANPMQANPMLPRAIQGPAQAMPQPMSQPQSRLPQPAPFPKAQRPIPVATRASAQAVPMATGVAPAPATPPLPPPSAPPRPADELADLATTPMRRRVIRKKRNQIPNELIIGGIVLALGALGVVIYAANQSTAEKHGYDQIETPKLPVITAADAAGSDLKKAQLAKDSAKKATGSSAVSGDKRSRSITTTGSDRPARSNPAPQSVNRTVVNRPGANGQGVNGPDDIVSPNQFTAPAHGADDASLNKLGGSNIAPNNAAPRVVHADGPANGPINNGDDPVMEDLNGDPKK